MQSGIIVILQRKLSPFMGVVTISGLDKNQAARQTEKWGWDCHMPETWRGLGGQTNIWPLVYSSQSQVRQELLPPSVKKKKVCSDNGGARLCFPAGPVWEEYVWSQNTSGGLLSPCPTHVNYINIYILLIFAPISRHPLSSTFTLFIPKHYHSLSYRSSSTYWVKPSLTKPANADGLPPNSKSTISPWSYFHLFNKYVLATYYVPGTVAGVGDIAVNRTHYKKKKRSLASWSFHSTKGDN